MALRWPTGWPSATVTVTGSASLSWAAVGRGVFWAPACLRSSWPSWAEAAWAAFWAAWEDMEEPMLPAAWLVSTVMVGGAALPWGAGCGAVSAATVAE